MREAASEWIGIVVHDDSTIPDSVQCSYEAAGGGGRRVGGGREKGRNEKSIGPCDLTVQRSDTRGYTGRMLEV